MKIKGVQTINFRNLNSGKTYEFNSNFVVVYGQNEAGKTSMLEAIEFAFFGKVDRHKKPDFMTWGKSEMPVIKLWIEIDEEDTVIERNYQDARSYMKGKGVDLKDDKKIRSKLEKIIGFNDPDTFRNLLTIKQNEMVNIEIDGIQKEFETLITGGIDGISVIEILSLLDSKLSKERDRFKGEDWRVYDRIQQNLDELQVKGDLLKRDLDEAEFKRARLDEIRKSLEIDKKDIESVQMVLNWLNMFIPYREADTKMDELRRIEAKIDVLVRDVEEIKKSVMEREEKLKIYKEFRENQKNLEEKEKELLSIRKRYTEITEKERESKEIESDLKDKEIPSKDDLERFKKLRIQIKQLESTLESQAIIFDVKATRDIEIVFSGTERPLQSGERYPFEIKKHVEVLFIKDVADISIKNKGITDASENLNNCNQEIKKLVDRFNSSSIDELEQRYEKDLKRKILHQEMVRLLESRTIKEILNIMNSLNAEIEKLRDEIENLSKKLGDIKSLEVEEAVLMSDKHRLTVKEKELNELKLKRAHVLGQNTKEDLEKLKIVHGLSLSKIEITDNEKDALINLSLSDLKKKREVMLEKLESLNKRIQANETEKAYLQGELKIIPSYEELLSIEEKIAELEGIRKKADVLLKALIVLEENLKKASEATKSIILTELDNLSSKYFYDLTAGKYDRVMIALDRKISIKVKESGREESREVFNRSLSTGAMQQLYFALRLALIEILTGNRKLPIILDDPFVDFDSERRKGAIEILRKLSNDGYQCLLFTCHDFILKELNENCQVVII